MIKLVDALAAVVPEVDRNKQFFHSKAIALLVRSVDKGGCQAAGGLTSQGLLYTMCCLGLIPMGLARWGEVVVDHPFLEKVGITIENGKAEQFLAALTHSLCVSPCEAESKSYASIAVTWRAQMTSARMPSTRDSACM